MSLLLRLSCALDRRPEPLISKIVIEVKNKSAKKKRKFNPLGMVILSGALGLFTSTMALKYIQGMQNDSINPQRSDIFLFDKKISS